jgi:hypothetical protein
MTDENKTNSEELSELTLPQTIERLAAVNYSFDEMAIYIGMKKSAFRHEASTVDSVIWTAIQKGRLQAEFEINDKLSQNARSGNITAAQIVQKIKQEKHVENLKSTIFYGE